MIIRIFNIICIVLSILNALILYKYTKTDDGITGLFSPDNFRSMLGSILMINLSLFIVSNTISLNYLI